MTCCFCGRIGAGKPLPRGWKVCGLIVCCRDCQKQQYRLRSLTMRLAEPGGLLGQEFSAAFEEARNEAKRLVIPGQAWKPKIAEGHAWMHLCIDNRWWALRLDDAHWSPGRRDTYRKVATGEAVAGELLVYRRTGNVELDRGGASRASPAPGIGFKAVAWLPRNFYELARTPIALTTRATRPDPGIRSLSIQEIDIGNLRKAVRANWVSFPSQIPIFPAGRHAHLEPKLVQLYFVMGWSCARIAARYGLAYDQVRHILNEWKWRAANAGYIQHIPCADNGDRDDLLYL
jgi:hypothetical protein